MRIQFALFLLLAVLVQIFSQELVKTTTFAPEGCDAARKSVKGDTLDMNYVGTIDETSVTGQKGRQFDSSIGRRPFTFTLGAGQVIKGWDQGLEGMCVGEKRTLIIPPDMGYGARGAGRDIPGGATLRFEVELLNIKDSGKANEPKAPPQNLFKQIDANGDKRISYDEMADWFASIGKNEIPRGLWEKEDKNEDRYVTWEEFSGPKGQSADEL